LIFNSLISGDMHLRALVLVLMVASCRLAPTRMRAIGGGPVADGGGSTRLRVVNGSPSDLWIFYQIGEGGGSMSASTPHQILLAGGQHHDYPIPDRGLASVRVWAGVGCDRTGNNCQIGQSGGPPDEGFSCPDYHCAPPVDSKFEGTFGCLPTVDAGGCLPNPSDPQHRPLPATDSFDTSLVDGFTVPFRVRVSGSCPGGPVGGEVDCSGLALSMCPSAEDISSRGQFPTLASEDLRVIHPLTGASAGCYGDCSRLTMPQWQSTAILPAAPQAQLYCCPTPPISPDVCRAGPGASSGYTSLAHAQCPQTYAYAYDDARGLFACPAGVRYEVTFYAPR